jgi:cell division septum initiation protein DivIVA
MASKLLVDGQEMEVQAAVDMLVRSLKEMSDKNIIQEQENEELKKQIH